MTLSKEFSDLVSKSKKNGSDISINPLGQSLNHMALGLAGEVGELVDTIKKFTIYEITPLNVDNIIEELGDIEWYLEGLRQDLALSREEILNKNILKLQKRYPDGGYSNKNAEKRLDKND